MALGRNAYADAIQLAQSEKKVHKQKNQLWIYHKSYVGLLDSGHGVSSFGNLGIELTFEASASARATNFTSTVGHRGQQHRKRTP